MHVFRSPNHAQENFEPQAGSKEMRIVVTDLIGSIPVAGLTLHYLQYLLGLRALGHDVLYLEDTGTWAPGTMNPALTAW